MEPKKQPKTKWLTIRLTAAEYEKVHQLFKDSTANGLSDYARKLILNKPVNVRYRNVSIDDFLADMLVLKRELNAIGNNVNQAVVRLRMLKAIPDLERWLIQNEQDKATLMAQIETILFRINQLYALWSPS
jgi:hypothetical protein